MGSFSTNGIVIVLRCLFPPYCSALTFNDSWPKLERSRGVWSRKRDFAIQRRLITFAWTMKESREENVSQRSKDYPSKAGEQISGTKKQEGEEREEREINFIRKQLQFNFVAPVLNAKLGTIGRQVSLLFFYSKGFTRRYIRYIIP